MLLSARNLNINFETAKGTLEAIRDISFDLKQGETLGVVGESGCGKSITNLAILGLLPHTARVTASELLFEGEDLLQKSEKEMQKIRGGQIGMIFQDPMSALNPGLTVGYQLTETLKLHEKNLSKKERMEKALDLLDKVGIPAPKDRIGSFAHELSGGMSQRVMIAMAIACRPKLLIADEPTTALDVTIQDQILRLLKDLQEEQKMAMILVTHDLGVVAQNADRIQVMYAGEIIESGTADSIVHSPVHHYTQGLLDSLPGKQGTAFRQPLPSISGMVPNLFHRPKGCQFHPRCEKAAQECKVTNPELINHGANLCRCHYPLGGDS